MKIFPWILLMIASVPACMATTTDALSAVTPGDSDGFEVVLAPSDGIFHRELDPLPGQCCGMCTQLIFNLQVVSLLIAFDTSVGGELNPSNLPSTSYIVIIVRLIIVYVDNIDGATKTISFDQEVLPEHWNTPCSYTADCAVFANDEIVMFAPPKVGGFGVLSLENVQTFTESSDVTILSTACDLRCQDETLCTEFAPAGGSLQPDGAGIPFGVVNANTFNSGFCTPDIFGVENDPHLKGLRGQDVEWHGVDGGWYSLLVDESADLHVNMRPTAPLPDTFPERQYITGVAVLSEGHSLVAEVKDPHSIVTGGCPEGVYPCLAGGGLRISVDGEEVESLLSPATDEFVSNGITMSTSNLPAECREFGGGKAWARRFSSARHRHLMTVPSFGDWFLASSDHVAAPEWCAKYIAEHDLAQVQSNQSVLKIVTPSVIVRFAAGVNHRSGGKMDRHGRDLPELDFWQGSIALSGLTLGHEDISGMLGETARPTMDKEGHELMEGLDALRGTVEDYRVSGPLATDFVLLN